MAVSDSRRRVDYDAVAGDYHVRYDRGRMAALGEALHAVVGERRPRAVLEVGCATGRWLAELSPGLPLLVGLDASTEMLSRAPRAAALVRGLANALPFRAGAFDLVYCVNALHHFQDPHDFVGAAARLLRPGGTLVVVGLDVHVPRERWYLWEFFAGSYETDQLRFPRWEQIGTWMGEAGLRPEPLRCVEQVRASRTGRDVLADPFLQKSSNSQLLLLDESAYQAGLRRLEQAVAEAEAAGVERVFPIDLDFVMRLGRSADASRR